MNLADRHLLRAGLVVATGTGDRGIIRLDLIASRVLFGRSSAWRHQAVSDLAERLRQLAREAA